MEFGEKLKKLRLEHQMTQSQVADYIGVTYQTCLSYEAGKSYPRRSGILEKLAELFNCDPEYLFSEKNAFETRAERMYGTVGTKDAYFLAEELSSIFAGKELSETDADTIMEKLEMAYWDYRRNSRKKPRRTRVNKDK